MTTDITFLPKTWALDLVGVVAPGIPNQECVYLRANIQLDLGEYFLVAGWKLTNDLAVPLNTDSFWLGKFHIDAGHWVAVYTGPGERRMTQMTAGDPCLVLHWGRERTIFNRPEVVPLLIHVDSVAVGRQISPALPK